MEEEEEEIYEPYVPEKLSEPIPVCRCLNDDASSEKWQMPARKQKILSTVSRTEEYLRKRRIPELMRFLLTKIIAKASDKPTAYLEKLLDDCMLFRAGLGHAPVLYNRSHVEAVVKSFDPGDRGWFSEGQIRRAFATLGLTPEGILEDRVPTEIVLQELLRIQEKELYQLVAAGSQFEEFSLVSSAGSDTLF